MPLTIEAIETYLDDGAKQAALAHAANAFYDPGLKVDEDKARAVFNDKMLEQLSAAAQPGLFLLIRQAVENAYQVFIAMNGTRPDDSAENTQACLDWEDKLDDHLAEVLSGDFRNVASIDWTEQHTVDIRGHDFMERDTLAMNAAVQYSKMMISPELKEGWSTAKMMSAFGMTSMSDEMDAEWAKVWARIKGESDEQEKLSYEAARRRVEEIVIPYAQGRGEDLDLDEFQAHLANATDRDPTLAAHSIMELGGEPGEDHAAFRIYAADGDPNWMEQVVSTAIDGELTPMEGDVQAVIVDTHTGEAFDAQTGEALEGEVIPPLPDALKRNTDQPDPVPSGETAGEAQAVTTSDAQHSADDTAKTEPSTEGGADQPDDPPQVDQNAALGALQVLRDHTNLSDTDIATELAVSRQSVSNWGRGKGKMEATPEMVSAMAKMLEKEGTAVQAALMSLEGR